jgi:ABC-type polysaccharide/polyol phosphate transport system ATPase subunit
VVELVLWLALRARRKKRRVEIRQKRENVEVENLNAPEELEQSVTLNLKNEVTALLHNEQMEAELGKPVIVVDDVTMEFHLSSSNPSGLKEYLIQLLKREVTYRKLYALYHVSFKVYRGEIVGIIGTNGSGKSTLLKIISGALKPTGGHVEVDRRKIQLLTLGTGFDMELTARENVYLNGSIIGYSKEFLDRHYEEIVAFAELSDFMEEKVKNFSSGMVSRLGFAIATAGEAAEILILDEVLSVGDEFFKKKSLKRVKEMIHGGSTVLMVSHGMDTILQNCTKCVWIEKGELRMIGEPKVVCGEYQRLSCQ